MGFNAATLNLQGWFRAPFAGSPWGPTASAGNSGTGGSQVQATTPATVGATVNGYATADFDGSSKFLTNDTFQVSGRFISPVAWSIACLIRPRTTAAAR